MASDGPRFGTTVDDAAGSSGSITWSNPGNADESASALLATAALTSISQSHFLHTSSYGFAIPAGSTIDGIEMTVRRNKSGASTAITDKIVRLYKGGTVDINADKADVITSYTASFVVVTYGGPTDKWNDTWTVSDINASNFGTAFCCGEGGSGAGTAQVDYVQAKVYYTAPPPPPGPMANAQISLQTERAV